MGTNTTIKAVLWAANAVAWGCVYVIDRNLKSERRREATCQPGQIAVDLTGVPLQVTYQRKMFPEFTIYQV